MKVFNAILKATGIVALFTLAVAMTMDIHMPRVHGQQATTGLPAQQLIGYTNPASSPYVCNVGLANVNYIQFNSTSGSVAGIFMCSDATNTGNYQWNAMAITGPQGPQGPIGPTGSAGTQGSPGTTGATGSAGPSGAVLIGSATISGSITLGAIAGVLTQNITLSGVTAGSTYLVLPTAAPTTGFMAYAGAFGAGTNSLAVFYTIPSVTFLTNYTVPVKVFKIG